MTTTRRGRPPLSEADRAEQRKRLLDATMEAIRRHGPEVSVDDIAATAGVSKPVLYGHFGDKLGLADAVATYLADSVFGVSLAALDDGDPDVGFTRAIEAIVGPLVDLVESEPEIYGFLVRTIRRGENGFLDNALVDVIRLRGGQLVAMAGPTIDPDLTAVLVDGAFGFLLFAVESWQDSRVMPREQFVATLVDVVIAGFGAAA